VVDDEQPGHPGILPARSGAQRPVHLRGVPEDGDVAAAGRGTAELGVAEGPPVGQPGTPLGGAGSSTVAGSLVHPGSRSPRRGRSDRTTPGAVTPSLRRVRTDRGLDRLITFLDAVVAIAITLLVLPLVDVIPDEGATVDLRDLLADEASRFGAFALSFAVIAQQWLVHHRIVERIGSYDMPFVLVNLVWTLTIVLLPFATEVAAVYGDSRLAIGIYIGTMTLSSTCLTLLTLFLVRRPYLRRPGADPAETLERLSESARHASRWGRTDYGRAFRAFLERHGEALGPRTSLLVLGDARSNYTDPRTDALAAMVRASRHAWWLNPEHPRQWDTGDSAASEYGAILPMVECRNLTQLTEFVHDIL